MSTQIHITNTQTNEARTFRTNGDPEHDEALIANLKGSVE